MMCCKSWLMGVLGLLLVASGCGSSLLGGANEVCDNTIDDDGDGLTDCTDSDCTGVAACQDKCGNGAVDPDELCDIAAAGAGACPKTVADCDDGYRCTADRIDGARCLARCSHTAITEPANGDTCCPQGATAVTDSDCPASCGDDECQSAEDCDSCATDCGGCCGNGVVEPPERCDTQIPAGSAGACPTAASCDDSDPCTLDGVLNDGGCDAQCSNAPVLECKGGDGCCPSSCDGLSDSDCAPSCGNGIVEPPELCDTLIPEGEPGACPTLASCDDLDDCTHDTLQHLGDCYDVCDHGDIYECQGGDGCCPAGCSSLADPDCPSDCGNGLIDADELCDTAIAWGEPGACPTGCGFVNYCSSQELVGDGCQKRCQISFVEVCQDSDDCCPLGCDPFSDSDCLEQPGCIDPFPWGQFRQDGAHRGVQQLPVLCASLPDIPTAPAILWTAELGAPIWNSPGISERGIHAAAGGTDGVTVYLLDPESGAAAVTSSIPADPKLATGLMFVSLNPYRQGTAVLSSPAGGLWHFSLYDQKPQAVPNVVLSENGWVYLSPGGQLESYNYTGVGSCYHPEDVEGTSVAALNGSYTALFSTFRDTEPGVTVFVLSNVDQPTKRCGGDDWLAGIPAAGGSMVVHLTPGGDVVGEQWSAAEGQQVWRRSLGLPFTSPVMDTYGRSYVGAGDGTLFGLSAGGELLWQLPLGASFQDPAIVGGNYPLILVGTSDGRLIGIREGKALWTVQLEGALTGPVVRSDALIVVGSSTGKVWGLRRPVEVIDPEYPGQPPFPYAPLQVTRTWEDGTPAERDDYLYDAQGRLSLETNSTLGANGYQPARKYDHVYDVSGQLQTVTYSYSFPDSGWQELTRDLHTWSAGRMTQITEQGLYQGTWKDSGRIVYEYDAAARLSHQQYEVLGADGQWSTRSHDYYHYGTDGRLGSLESTRYNDTSEVWLRYTGSYFYDPRGRLIDESRYYDNGSAGSQYLYDLQGRLDRVIFSYCGSGGCRVSSRWRYVYAADGKLEQRIVELYDAGTNTWSPDLQVDIVTTDTANTDSWDVFPYPIRQWVIELFGQGELNRYRTPGP